MEQHIGIRREDLDKRGEQRVALTPTQVQMLTQQGHRVWVQPGVHPETGEVKRAFADEAYRGAGAQVSEDLSKARLIFGLKEVKEGQLLPGRTYLFFSHTHKGQVKNRPLLRTMQQQAITLIDYELITDPEDRRRLTAFTYFAGYAGMTDSLWTLGQRYRQRGLDHPLGLIPQSISAGSLEAVHRLIEQAGNQIREKGTPAELPPLITGFLGNGKTSAGAQEIYDRLPVQAITLAELPDAWAHGARNQVYKLVLEVPDMFRLKAAAPLSIDERDRLGFYQTYRRQPEHFESNLDQVFPYCPLLMNCITWGPTYPRLISRDQAAAWYAQAQTLEVIGDITCDPEGAIQFSRETWIDEPVFIYDPLTRESLLGFEGPGVAVMAVTNLPCEFSADASERFAHELGALLPDLLTADWDAPTLDEAGLSAALREATILWRGQLTPRYAYMAAFG